MPRPVAFVYRNAQAYAPGARHVGLGVNAMHMVNVLSARRVRVESHSAYEINDLTTLLDSIDPASVVVLEALWVTTENCGKLLGRFPRMTFVVRCHSQVGFLQNEPPAIKLLREQLVLQEHSRRFVVAGNSRRFTDWVTASYRVPCAYLPNLYTLDRAARKPHPVHSDRLLRVGSFGALRHLKMHICGAAGALVAARVLHRDLEFHVQSGRKEGGDTVLTAIRHMLGGLAGVSVVEDPWLPWAEFRTLVSHMDCCVQTSVTETFNLVTADAASEGTPCVVGPAIDWVPADWVAPVDDPVAIGRKIVHLVHDPRAGDAGVEALRRHNDDATRVWLAWLKRQGAA